MREQSGGYMEEHDFYSTRPSDLKPMDELKDWEIAEGQDIRGWTLADENGDSIGKIRDILVDIKTDEAVFAIVEHGGLMGLGAKKTLIPLDQLRLDSVNQRVIYPMPADHISGAPSYTGERNYDQFYDYWSGRFGAGRAETIEERELIEGRAGGMAEATGQVIPEVEEHLEVGKRTEQVGEVEVRKEVETRPETVRERVQKTRIRVFRRPVEPGREVGAGEQVMREGESITVPVVEEHLVVEKRAEVTGEVVIQPETIEEEEEVTREVRKEHVEVEKRGDADVEEEEEEESRRTSGF